MSFKIRLLWLVLWLFSHRRCVWDAMMSGQNPENVKGKDLSLVQAWVWYKILSAWRGDVVKMRYVLKKYFNRDLSREELDKIVERRTWDFYFSGSTECLGDLRDKLELRKAITGKWISDHEMTRIAIKIREDIHYNVRSFEEIPRYLEAQWPMEAINILGAYAPKACICQGEYQNYMKLDPERVFRFWELIGYQRAKSLGSEAKMVLFETLGGGY